MSAEDAGVRTAAVIVVGTELVQGLHADTNGPEVARRVAEAGFDVCAITALPDDSAALARHLCDAVSACDLVVVTGGLGPTHDDITREAAADALGLCLRTDPVLEERLGRVVVGHLEPAAAAQVVKQALVIEGAAVLWPTTGTAPGQVIPTSRGHLILLPGPPREMRPMLAEALASLSSVQRSAPIVLGCVGLRESDAQIRAQRALGVRSGITLTVLGRPALVDVVLFDRGAGTAALADASREVEAALAPHCYSADGSTLAEVVLTSAVDHGMSIGVAESCTGGLVGAALTDAPGSSAAFRGGVIAYANEVKTGVLGVSEQIIAAHGAVSGECATAMAIGARELLRADIALSVTGIAGPDGGSADKPVGLVWFAVADATGVVTRSHIFAGDRAGVRARATVLALELLRHAVGGQAGR